MERFFHQTWNWIIRAAANGTNTVELLFGGQNEFLERWRELTPTRFGPLALTFSGLGASRSTSTESEPLPATRRLTSGIWNPLLA